MSTNNVKLTNPETKGGWNYRVIVTESMPGLFPGMVTMAVHEVYYSKEGEPDSWTIEAVDFGGESVEEVARALTQAAADILRYPPLIESGGILVEYEGPGA